MNNTIYKYTLDGSNIIEIELPIDAKILTVQMQHGELQLWAMVNRFETEKANRRILMVGTGRLIKINDKNLTYISTVQMLSLVFRFFEILD